MPRKWWAQSKASIRETGNYFDDTKRYVDALALSEADRQLVYSGNARRVFPRLDALLKKRGR